jgi:hypothetical protein
MLAGMPTTATPKQARRALRAPQPAPPGARTGFLACTLLAPSGAALPRIFTHAEPARLIRNSSDYVVRSCYSDGGHIDRRYNMRGFLIDVDPIRVVA